MADETRNSPIASRISASVAKALISVLLMLLTVATSFIAVILLSCTLTQGRMSSLSVDGVSLSVWKLDAIRQDWSTVRDRIKEQQSALTTAQLKLTETTSTRSVAEEKSESAKAALLAVLEQANFHILPIDRSLAEEISGKGVIEQVGRLQAGSEQLLKDHPELKSLLDQISADYNVYTPAHNKFLSARSENDAATAKVNDILGQTKRSNQQLETLFDSIKSHLDEAGRAKIENALYEITPLGGRIGSFMHRLITLPPEVLALSLVILMGILGSLLQIVHSFFRRDVSEEPEGLGIYFVRIAAGGVTALVIFIVAKAGVPIVADASRLGGDAPINPYFISFLAIISGLLSEQAIASVQAKGAQFFPANPAIDIQRWVRDDLTQKASSDGNSIADLAAYLDLDPKVTADLLDGSAPATEIQQRTIAAYLHGSSRDLFTDLAPEGKTDDGKKPDDQKKTGDEKPVQDDAPAARDSGAPRSDDNA
jgi:hypothetical protein